MSMNIRDKCVESYLRLKRLKSVGDELGVPWQTVYVHLRAAGVPVTGDKSRYGSETDRLAAKGEAYFESLVPSAENQNKACFQPRFDFLVHGNKVDVKTSTKRKSNKNSQVERWAFSSAKQESEADFFVLIGYDEANPKHVWLIPGEIARNYKTISISCKTKGKWWDYEIEARQLSEFFQSLRRVVA